LQAGLGDPTAKAQQLALNAQGGAVNSAVGAAKSAGMSPAQAALMGAMAGSNTYQNTFANAYQTLNEQGIQEQGVQNQAAQFNAGQTNTMATTQAELQNTVNTFNAGQQNQLSEADTTAQNQFALTLGQQGLTQQEITNALSLGQQAINAGQATDWAGLISGILSGTASNTDLTSAIAKILGLTPSAEGTENAEGGSALVGEHGPEKVYLPKGAKVVPIHDGFDILQYVTNKIKNPVDNQSVKPTSSTDKKVQIDKISELSRQADRALSYLKRGA
jgi:hypothetical protein